MDKSSEELAAAREEIWHLKGAMKADDERLVAAALKAGIPYFGCDTADQLAETIIEQRAEITTLRLKYIKEHWNVGCF